MEIGFLFLYEEIPMKFRGNKKHPTGKQWSQTSSDSFEKTTQSSKKTQGDKACGKIDGNLDSKTFTNSGYGFSQIRPEKNLQNSWNICFEIKFTTSELPNSIDSSYCGFRFLWTCFFRPIEFIKKNMLPFQGRKIPPTSLSSGFTKALRHLQLCVQSRLQFPRSKSPDFCTKNMSCPIRAENAML